MSASDYFNGAYPWEDDEPTIYPKRDRCKFCGETGLKWKTFGFMSYKLVTRDKEELHICKHKNNN